MEMSFVVIVIMSVVSAIETRKMILEEHDHRTTIENIYFFQFITED
jgi:hypothetical protein